MESFESYTSSPLSLLAYQQRILLSNLKPLSREKLLEVGCNSGIIVQKLRASGLDVIGIDFNHAAVKDCNYLQQMDAQDLQFADSSFDKIFSIHTIEHIPDPHKAIAEMSRVLRPGGRIVLVYPAEPIRGFFVLYRALKVYKNPLSARKIHLHRFHPRKIRGIAHQYGLSYVKSSMQFAPFPQFLTVLEKN